MLRADVRRAIVGYTDGTIRAANRMIELLYRRFGRRNFKSVDVYYVTLPESAFERIHRRPPTPIERELRIAIRALTEYDYSPETVRQLSRILGLFSGRYDTARILQRRIIRGRLHWFIREHAER